MQAFPTFFLGLLYKHNVHKRYFPFNEAIKDISWAFWCASSAWKQKNKLFEFNDNTHIMGWNCRYNKKTFPFN